MTLVFRVRVQGLGFRADWQSLGSKKGLELRVRFRVKGTGLKVRGFVSGCADVL